MIQRSNLQYFVNFVYGLHLKLGNRLLTLFIFDYALSFSSSRIVTLFQILLFPERHF